MLSGVSVEGHAAMNLNLKQLSSKRHEEGGSPTPHSGRFLLHLATDAAHRRSGRLNNMGGIAVVDNSIIPTLTDSGAT